tara:strand:+ start:684 stop:905 length:222 start_codon:yes stop_codon:yes gene_type:complete
MKLEEDILFYAFRYALGRRTHAVSTVCEFIIKNWDAIHPFTQDMIKSEITTAIEDDSIGMEMDKNEWERILDL